MTYEVGKIGIKFLWIMQITWNINRENPNAALNILNPDDTNSFYYSVFNKNFYPRAAAEIYGKLFTPEEQTKLQELMAELEKEEASLIQNANSKVSETMKKYMEIAEQLKKERSSKLKEEGTATGITCTIFKKIPVPALNLLALIEIKQEYFPESYHFFKEMLEELNGSGGEYYTKEENPPKKQPEKDENKPDNPNENPENKDPKKQNGPENNQNPNGTDNNETLRTLKNQTISSITAALNKNPPLTNSELSSQYQDWENSINQFSDEKQINLLKRGILSYIQGQRKKKIKNQTAEE
ncbi:6754_t:CDS:2, partial [Funneliformis geosporum]